ncbi:MAG: hypothetical protein EOO25_05820 [Comamonadaceae bacterium]|nr:MAG: hypothetical protein EOO25_05820 [Comamonadaceae bacterium]
MRKILLLALTHLLVLCLGIALGIYLLPILAAPPAPTAQEVRTAAVGGTYTAVFRRDLKGSDALHWGEGTVSVGPATVSFMGRLAPGPAYRLYLSPGLVETEADFLRVKAQSLPVGDVKTFDNFIVALPPGTPLERYQTVVIWCESFSQFITAGKYR